MLKTVKGKVITGVVAVGLLSGMGAAFANSDAGALLKDWYNSKFKESAASIEKNVTNYANGKVPALKKEYNQLKEDAAKSINATRDSEIDGSKEEIAKAKNEHINSLNATEADIKAEIDKHFDVIFAAANAVINFLGERAYQYAEKDLGRFTDDKGKAALEQVNQDLTAAKDEAVKELQAEIEKSKAELQALLDSHSDTTTEEIKQAIDAKIVELRGKITAKKNELVAVQQQLIAAKAQELEDAAKAELDAVVSSINK